MISWNILKIGANFLFSITYPMLILYNITREGKSLNNSDSISGIKSRIYNKELQTGLQSSVPPTMTSNDQVNKPQTLMQHTNCHSFSA